MMEFQLPYVALRSDGTKRDPRNLRSSRPMLRSEGENDAGILYEAQISFLLVEVDEWYWTAYCFVETYFGSEKSIDWYREAPPEPNQPISPPFDGPTGGCQLSTLVVWNPREYFLFVFSRWMSQIAMEWNNIVSALDKKLDIYVRNPASRHGEQC